MEQTDVWPLAGRVDELRAIEEELASGRTSGIVVVGDAGVGTTRLLREALARWSAAGGDVEWLVATPGVHSIPFGTVSHLLPPGLAHGGSALALMARVADGFAARAGGGPVVVAVDDAHLLDEASASLLRQLAERGLVVPLVSAHGGELVPPAVTDLWKDARRLAVPPLPAIAVDQILDHALAGQIDPISRRRLRELVAGNPLLLRELLADAREAGALRQREGVWRWQGAVPVTARLAELVTSRLAAVDPAVLPALEAIACGEPLALPVLEQVVDPDAIEEAERSGFAVAERSGNRVSLRLSHPLYGEALRANLPASRARAIWRALADVLAAGPMRRRDDVLVASVWDLRSGAVRHPRLLLAGARQAVARFDLDLAERLVRGARDNLLGGGGDWAADCLLAQILQYRARYTEAIDVLPAAPPQGSADAATWAVTRASILYWGLDRVAEAEQTLWTTARSAPGQDRPEALYSWILLFDGRCRSALAVAETVLDRPDASDSAVVWAAMSGAAAAGWLGRLDRAAAIGERGRAVADALTEGRPWAQAQVGYGMCHAWYAAGELRRAEDIADRGHRAAVAGNAVAMTGMWAGLRGIVAKAQGRLADAEAALREAVALLEDNDEYQCVRPCLAELAGAAALSGAVTTARDWLRRADEHKRAVNRLYDPWVELDRAWVQAATGAVSTAAGTALQAADLARDTEQPAYEAVALYDAVRLGSGRPARERLETLAGQLDGDVVPALARAATALATGSAASLEECATVFIEHGHLLLAAEVTAAAARAHWRAGRTSRMRATAERAAALAAACQGARTPLLDLSGFGTVLTRREREVAALAVDLPSREVADRLGLSVHTVNNTLARAYAKLGVRSRGELGSVLGPPDPQWNVWLGPVRA